MQLFQTARLASMFRCGDSNGFAVLVVIAQALGEITQ